MRDFAVFILTHGRPDRVFTIESLRQAGYKGKIYLVVDDEDKTANEYIERFGKDNVIIFNKKEAVENTDDADIFDDKRAVVYARNKTFDIAKDLGLKYFLVLDDDYTLFRFRYATNGVLHGVQMKNINEVIEIFIDFLEKSGALTVSFSQGGDFIGGTGSNVWRRVLPRKSMNVFFCKTDRPFKFLGKINEDATMYVVNGIRGKLCFTYAPVSVEQKDTQSNPGGLTDIYLNLGTYIKSFYTVMYAPSCVKVAPMGGGHYRCHHRIYWDNCTPKILSEKWKKES